MKRIASFATVILFSGWANAWSATINVPADQPTIQAGIDAAVSGVDEVVVAPGSYNEVIGFNGKAITVRSSGGPGVTTIDGTGHNNSVVKCVSGEGLDTILDGFKIIGGVGSGSDPKGGGMFNDGSSPTITNCVIDGNVSRLGGGMYNVNGSTPDVIGCVFSNNSSGAGSPVGIGGGVYNRFNSSATFIDCQFTDNSADTGGGMTNDILSNVILNNCSFNNNSTTSSSNQHGGAGMYNWGSWPVVTNSVFVGNSAVVRGGAVLNMEGSHGTFINCLLFDNTAAIGGAMSNFNETGPGSRSNPSVIGCTFANNTASTGGGIANEGNPVFTNCILWGNSDAGGTNEASQLRIISGNPIVNYSCVLGGWTGAGGNNISADPLFVTGPQGNFYLSQTSAGQGSDSPCIDVGIGLASDWYVTGTTRSDEVDDSGTVDMGHHYNGNLVDSDNDSDGIPNTFDNCPEFPNPTQKYSPADFDKDCDVDGIDFTAFASCFNKAGNPPRSLGCPQP